MALSIKNTSLIFHLVLLLNLSSPNSVKGKCADKDIYKNVSQLQSMMTDMRKKDLDSNRILLELINLSGYVLKDTVSLSSWYPPELSKDNHDNHRIYSIDSNDHIGVLSLGVYMNKTMPLWQNEEKQEALR